MYYIKTLTQYWWLELTKGLFALGLGLAFITWPGKSLVVIATFIGVFLLIDGIIESLKGVFSIKKDSHWWVHLAKGIVGVLAGIAIFNYPEFSLGILFFILALWAIISGIIGVVQAVKTRKESYGGWTLTGMSLLLVAFGILLLSNPQGSVLILTVLFGLFAVISGIMTVAFSMDLRAMNSDIKKLEK